MFISLAVPIDVGTQKEGRHGNVEEYTDKYP